MKFVLSSSLLSSRLQMLGRVVASKNNISILDSILFHLQGTQLTLTASDNENTLVTWLDVVESEADIDFTINAKTIQDGMKEIPEQPLEFYVNEETLEITVEYQNGVYKLMAQGAQDFPLPLAEEARMQFAMPARHLLGGLNRALFAAADDQYRPQMNGVFFDVKQNNISLVASDGHRLACSTTPKQYSQEEGSFILPKKPAGILRTILAKEEGDVNISYGDRLAVISAGAFRMTCRMIEGKYPNYNSVIPQDNPNVVTVDRQAMLSALRRVLVFSGAGSQLVKLHLEPNRMSLSGQDFDFAKSAEESLLCQYEGNVINIGFKGPFLSELLANIDSDEVVIRLADASRAGVISPATEEEGERVQMLLMPIMLNE